MESASRYNAHGYDINRNYPCPNGSHNTSIGGPYAFSEPEPRAIRDISQPTGNAINNCFVLGMTYHAGTECFNLRVELYADPLRRTTRCSSFRDRHMPTAPTPPD